MTTRYARPARADHARAPVDATPATPADAPADAPADDVDDVDADDGVDGMPSPAALADAVRAVRLARYCYAHAQLACALAPQRRASWVDEHTASEAEAEAIGTLDAMMQRLDVVASTTHDASVRADAHARMRAVLATLD